MRWCRRWFSSPTPMAHPSMWSGVPNIKQRWQLLSLLLLLPARNGEQLLSVRSSLQARRIHRVCAYPNERQEFNAAPAYC
jgi:hypothetical protein